MNIVHVGCGKRNWGKRFKFTDKDGNKVTAYVKHVDGGDYEHLDSKDIYLNDFKDDDLDLIYCSHMLEYFDREEVVGVLKAWMQKLKSGGKLYLAVPDFGAIAGMWHQEREPLHKFLGPLYGKMEMGSETIYHKTCYDESSLGELLRIVGYKRVELWEHDDLDWWEESWDDHSLAKIKRKYYAVDASISLNVVCEKK